MRVKKIYDSRNWNKYKKSPYIADYPTCHINEFSNKKVNKFYIYSLIKKGFEKKY